MVLWKYNIYVINVLFTLYTITYFIYAIQLYILFMLYKFNIYLEYHCRQIGKPGTLQIGTNWKTGFKVPRQIV